MTLAEKGEQRKIEFRYSLRPLSNTSQEFVTAEKKKKKKREREEAALAYRHCVCTGIV